MHSEPRIYVNIPASVGYSFSMPCLFFSPRPLFTLPVSTFGSNDTNIELDAHLFYTLIIEDAN